jgi:hypothetical protein
MTIEGGAPEAYADFTVPDGASFEGANLETFKSFAKEHDYTQAQAQAALNLEAQRQINSPGEVAPDSYEDFKYPEGLAIDETELKLFTEYARAQGWDQKRAQGAIDFEMQRMLRTQAQAMDAAEASHNEAVAKLEARAKADVDYGGSEYDANMAANEALLQLVFAKKPEGLTELQEVLQVTGVHAHPAFKFLLHSMRKWIPASPGQSPGLRPVTHTGSGVPKADQLYPEQAKQRDSRGR